MQEILLGIFEVIIGIVAAYVIKFINAKAKEAKVNLESTLANRYISELEDAVTTAVLHTAQTYVDALKKSGKWDKESQKTALSLALEEANSLLSYEARAFLSMLHTDLQECLMYKIEAEVKLLHMQEG